jgi:hypothetical protein
MRRQQPTPRHQRKCRSSFCAPHGQALTLESYHSLTRIREGVPSWILLCAVLHLPQAYTPPFHTDVHAAKQADAQPHVQSAGVLCGEQFPGRQREPRLAKHLHGYGRHGRRSDLPSGLCRDLERQRHRIRHGRRCLACLCP